ncbi:LPXTG cell wall anchor domain-containing protein [Listeria aquatica]|uniref:LPXTG cell wall anchor domain-containing protein n=1 Tax=Listeria aquatica TaxID=1494960 RepID=UPI003F6F5F99
MKKSLFIISLCALFFISPTSVFANNPVSHAESHAGIHFISEDEKNDSAQNEKNKNATYPSKSTNKTIGNEKRNSSRTASISHLPQTGDTAESPLPSIGIILIGIYFIQNKKRKEEKTQ